MTRIDYSQYNPSLTLKENAVILGCSISALKKHLKKEEIDVGYDTAFSRWKKINEYRKAHPSLSLRKKSEELGYSINTIRKYEAMSEEVLDVSFRDTEKVSRFDIKNENCIKSISDNQDEILRWIIQLYNEEKTFDADLTASLLKFYKNIPTPSYLFDKYPQLPNIKNLDEAKKLQDSVFHSIVFDLPFILSNKTPSKLKERFTQFYSKEELFNANDSMLNLSHRLLCTKGLLVVKTMDVCFGSRQVWVSDYVLSKAQELGFELMDKFILIAKMRMLKKTRQQKMARKYHSYLFVFKKKH